MKANSLDKNPRYDSFEQMLQSCKEEYCRQKYDAESVEKVIIDNIILKRKKSRTKRLISIMVAVALVLSSSIVISKSFLSDTGYANYIAKKIIYYISPVDTTIERFSDGSTATEIHIDSEQDLSELNKLADINYEFGYIPEGYMFKSCEASVSDRAELIGYVYAKGDLHLYISIQKSDYSGSMTLVGEYVRTLENGAELVCGKLDDENYTASLIDVEGKVYNIIGNCDKDEVIKVAENIIIR